MITGLLQLFLSISTLAADPDARCQELWSQGQVEALRKACGGHTDLADPIAHFWSLRTETDPNGLRLGLAPQALERRRGLDPRTLQLAAEYHFARGSSDELSRIARLAEQRFPQARETARIRALAGG